MQITGMHIYYYFVCQRKLWFFNKNIRLEQENENVQLGKLLDEESFQRENKQLLIDGVVKIDFIRGWKTIFEVKKSRAIEPASEWQLKYYMYVLREKGILIEKGIIDYPKIKHQTHVDLIDTDILKLKKIMNEIELLASLDHAPELVKKPICKKCAYYEYCFV
ncbi:CRISPR-associated protein Cas4 [Listeria ilorinensis]|uniref:CRISPR-associated protein Cas4 n=1 Tax=Listeria ilorinensis TaxID=2867439 RepID=UPI001EF3EFD0|nr:CRISPR-associated protein Cas4 [Listeria ilorinensis]